MRFERLAEQIYDKEAIMTGMAAETFIGGQSHIITFSHHYDLKNVKTLWEIATASATELNQLENKVIAWGPYTVSYKPMCIIMASDYALFM